MKTRTLILVCSLWGTACDPGSTDTDAPVGALDGGIDGGSEDANIRPVDAWRPVGDGGPDEGRTTRYVATHHVTPTATGSGDGSMANPWTWAQAYENATAGMRVQFAPGRYDSPGNDFDGSRGQRTLVFGPRNSGTEAEPIVFFAEYPAVYNPESMHSLLFNDIPTIQMGTVTGARPGTSYLVWDGFAMRQGPNNIYGSEESVFSAWDSHHIRILRCLFDQQGMGFDTGGANNWGAIFMQVVHHVEIADSIFRNIPGADENTATYLVYSVGEVEIHHNLFENNWSDYYLKGVHADAVYDLRPHRIHHNIHRDWHDRLMSVLGVGDGDRQPGSHCDFYQNTFSTTRGNLAVVYNPVSGGGARFFRFVNNTFYGDTHVGADAEDQGFHTLFGSPAGVSIWEGALFQNNIVHITGAVTDLMYGSAGPAPTITDLLRLAHRTNHYSPSFEDDDFFGGSLADWQAAGQDIGSLRGDPRLRAAASGDLRLAADSRALGAGTDVLQLLGGAASAPINMGAYILPDQSDGLGVRPRSITDLAP